MLICIVSTAIIFYILIQCIKCIKFKAHCKLQSKNNNVKSNSKVTDMHINNDNNSKDSVQIPSNNVDQTVIIKYYNVCSNVYYNIC